MPVGAPFHSSGNVAPSPSPVIASFAALALWPLAAGSYGIDLVSKVMIYAIFALSLELLVGGTGLVCFGQAGFFGLGAYAAVLLSPQSGSPALGSSGRRGAEQER